MHSAKIPIGRVVPGLVLLSIIMFGVAPNASASVTYPFGATAQGSVGGGQIDQNCGGSSGGAGFLQATFSCGPVGFATVMSSVSFGAASIRVEVDNINADAAGAATFFVEGTIGGTAPNGMLTWSDTGISSTPGGNVAIDILGPGSAGPFSTILGSACFQTGGCATSSTSISANAPVTNGEVVMLSFIMHCGTSGTEPNGTPAPLPQICEITDPMSLTLTNGLTFNSDVPNLFGGPGTTPEPSSLLLLGSGLLSFPWLRQRISTLRRRKA